MNNNNLIIFISAFMAPGNAAIVMKSQTTNYMTINAKELGMPKKKEQKKKGIYFNIQKKLKYQFDIKKIIENLTLMTSNDHVALTKLTIPFFARDKTLASKVFFFFLFIFSLI